jgi:outer membrane protein
MLSKIIKLFLIFALFIWASAQAEQKIIKLDLNQSVETAFKNNKTVLTLEEKIRASEYQIKQARSGFYPSLSAQATYTRLGVIPGTEIPAMQFGPIQTPAQKIKFGTEDNYDLNLSLTQPIFTWWKLTNAYKISLDNFSLKKEEYRQAKQEIKFNLTKTFYQILLAKELIKVREEAQKSIEDHLKTVQTRFENGQASQFDVLRAKVQLANSKPPLIQAKDLYSLSLNAFKNILGIALSDSLELSGELKFQPVEVNFGQAEKEALFNRSELKLLNTQQEMAQKSLSLAKAGNKPTLVGIANWDYKNPFNGVKRWDTDWSLTLALSFPFFDGFNAKWKTKEAQSNLSQLDIGKKQLEDGIRLELQQVITDLNLAQENILSQQENVGQAKEGLRIAQVQYKEGVITSLEVMDTELALTIAQTNYLQALSDYLIAQARYDKAVGKD